MASSIDHQRALLDDARFELRRAAVGAADAQDALEEVARRGRDPQSEDDARARAEAALREARLTLKGARARARAEGDALAIDLRGLLAPTAEEEVARLSALEPLVLMPVRIETRFTDGGATLLLRIYPDEIFADGFEPELTDDEMADGRAFWEAAWPGEAEERAAWRTLVAGGDSARAAWVAKAMTPTNVADRPAGAPVFPSPERKENSWTKPAEAWLLPDRWHVLLQTPAGQRLVTSANAVVEPLALTFSPDPSAPASPLEPDGLKLGDDVRWTVDFKRAVEVGMAMVIPLAPGERNGLQRVFVFGVKSSLAPDDSAGRLGDLLTRHRFGRGVAMVPQGTPTNNTSAASAPFPPPDPDGSHSFALERASGSPAPGPERDGPRLAAALGIGADIIRPFGGADGRESERAQAMARALWPVTWGYFLSELMKPVFDAEEIESARRFFVNHVRGRGPYAAFRIGGTPYGVLPVSSLGRWQPTPGRRIDAVDVALPQALRTLRQIWQSRTGAVPRIGRTGDPDKDLLETLGVDASAREVRVRPVMGEDATWNLVGMWGWADVWTAWLDAGQAVANQIFTALGHPEWRPRIARLNYNSKAWPFRFGLVTEDPVSETAGLSPNYIDWIRAASQPELVNETLPAGWQRPVSLLYRLLRHAALLEFHSASFRFGLKYQLLAAGDGAERELHGLPSQAGKLNRLQQMSLPIAQVSGDAPIHSYLADPINAATIVALFPDEPVVGLRDALAALSGASTGELERLTGETLDSCSHRLDAWITGLAAKRLEQMRAARPKGCHLGAYGWVEDLRPKPAGSQRVVELRDGRTAIVQRDSGGHIHAPSMNHAAAAAVLRSGYLSRSGADQGRYAVDLSSARVRAGRFVLDAVREGQPVGAVLGFQVERSLHDRDLDKWIDSLRARYPLVAAKAGDPEDFEDPNNPDQPKQHIAARNVVDGLALRAAFEDATIPWGQHGLPTGADRTAVERVLTELDATVDAVSDLLLAEGVYQLIKGSPGVAAATLDAMAQGTVRPPDPEIATQPRRGTPLTHKVAVVLGGPAGPLPAGYSALATDRAAVEPRLDAWLGQLFGPANRYRCDVVFTPSGAPPVAVTVRLGMLGVRPIDVVALARPRTEKMADAVRAPASELDRRVLEKAHALAGLTAETAAMITYGRPGAGFDPETDASFVDLLELARAAAAVLAKGRPLAPEDLIAEDRDADAKAADHRAAEALDRADDASRRLESAQQELELRLNASRAVPPGATFDLTNLRAALRSVAGLGLSGAYPANAFGDGPDARIELVAQGESVSTEAARRVEDADELVAEALKPEHAGDDRLRLSAAAEAVAKVCGAEMPFFPTFMPPAPGELSQALAHATTNVFIDASSTVRAAAIRDFERVAGRARPALDAWRRLEIVSGALGRRPLPRALAQVPYEADARWVALPFADEGSRPKPGRTSILLFQASAPPANTAWAGLLLDQWTEMIPLRTEQTGVAFHYDDPGAEAPQTLLLAVPPVSEAKQWQLDWLIDTLKETAELARIRAVDGEMLGELGQIMPAICLADSTDEVTVRSSFHSVIAQEAIVLKTRIT